jgi:hypothetical protein
VSRWTALLAAPLLVALTWAGCDLFMSEMSAGPALVDDDAGTDAGEDAGPDYCPGYTGNDPCCVPGDPCVWADDDICDCDATCDWDWEDC